MSLIRDDKHACVGLSFAWPRQLQMACLISIEEAFLAV